MNNNEQTLAEMLMRKKTLYKYDRLFLYASNIPLPTSRLCHQCKVSGFLRRWWLTGNKLRTNYLHFFWLSFSFFLLYVLQSLFRWLEGSSLSGLMVLLVSSLGRIYSHWWSSSLYHQHTTGQSSLVLLCYRCMCDILYMVVLLLVLIFLGHR